MRAVRVLAGDPRCVLRGLRAVDGGRVMDLPHNAGFPWNDMIDMTSTEGSRGIGISLGAVHEQLCVVADLLRELIGEVTALQQ